MSKFLIRYNDFPHRSRLIVSEVLPPGLLFLGLALFLIKPATLT